ncbi:MAG TPA: ATP-dependent DNA helicase RecG [Candidatus Alectryocaccobium stercorigallinarum]|nr:ATP-dependent DNA helicase RecG [Candidatus Alectryocaccobium stercorigallinarum]
MKPSNLLSEKRLISLKGIGDKMEKLFGKVGIYDLDQLIHYYPRAYDLYSDCVPAGKLIAGEKQSVLVRVQKTPVVKRGGRSAVTLLKVSDGTGSLEVIWFNMPYLRSVLKVGSEVVLRGMVVRKNNGLCMEHPEIIKPEAYDALKGNIQPVYSLTAGLKNKVIAKAVKQVFEKYSFYDYLPDDIIKKYSLADRDSALNRIHFPKDRSDLAKARERIVFDEFLFFFLRLSLLGSGTNVPENGHAADDFSLADKAVSNLKFELTEAQRRVCREIRDDLSSKHVMNRLLQGDVGSGKTVIAFYAILSMMKKGFQSALMAPTELLAEQHYASFVRLLKDNGISDEGVVLLTGSLTAKQKREAHEKAANGEALVVIGTHAIIQDKVSFRDLGLVITDEQHRFGVMQRKMISEKGNAPHILIMSATPIPRTLAIILYGDLNISVLDEMPAKRKRIKNCVVDTSYRKTAYTFIKNEVEAGRQAYVICPMIEPNEDLGCENVTEYTEKIRHIFPKNINIGMLHGRMSAEEKLDIMRDFSKNRINILVSTTVIEVGIDVPNATVMLIENAERFGLAQLHQLRGRIGRGDLQSYCIFMQGNPTEETNKRLEIVNNSNDGFYIAKEDLKLRGQGDLFGLRQSGEADFSLADPFEDMETLKKASEAVKNIMAEDAELSSEKYSLLAATLEQLDTFSDGVL